MSRSTQYIGLNHKAQEYVKRFVLASREEQGEKTFGMFDEEIVLRAWNHPEKGYVREVVQCTPWSSGPMIFTCLAWDFDNTIEIEDGEEVKVRDNSCTMFEWTHNPAVRDQEFNWETGEIWI